MCHFPAQRPPAPGPLCGGVCAPRLPRSHLCEQGSGGPGKLLCMPWGLYNLRKHLTIHVLNVASASRPPSWFSSQTRGEQGHGFHGGKGSIAQGSLNSSIPGGLAPQGKGLPSPALPLPQKQGTGWTVSAASAWVLSHSLLLAARALAPSQIQQTG